ncbi:hypothetical protein [Chitinophaga niabensis]|uniref:Uncharacterized protein n=1 Tax=Chitinophaga niabensis TaxID=536979 RepID=A0A1N6KAD4_9BACT|nr:hypothetical protein [Chitinophaga niabensis]SIO53508.1 hypothetical protein SAMN04488055_5428 [Chitinophaga niabensis]
MKLDILEEREITFKDFDAIMRKVTETNLFPSYLVQNNFRKIREGLYAGKKEELINVFYSEGEGWRYKNLKQLEDHGSLIQFIANRLHENKIGINRIPKDLIQSATIANNHYNQVVKTVKKENKNLPWEHFSSSSQQRKRVK